MNNRKNRFFNCKNKNMKIKELLESLKPDDLLVGVQYTRKFTYEIRSSNDVKKHSITRLQFDKLKKDLNFKHVGSKGLSVRIHYYRRSTIIKTETKEVK